MGLDLFSARGATAGGENGSSDPSRVIPPLSIPPAMTASTEQLQDWATSSIGRIARGAIAVTGLAFAVLVLMNAALVDSGSWALVILGVALAAASVRVALSPNLSRIIALGATTVAIPLSLQIF